MVVTAIIAAAVATAATAAATLIAGTILTWAAIGVAAAGAFISTGISYLLAEKAGARAPVGSASRTARAMLRQAVVPARYVMGEARVGGWLFYAAATDVERRLDLAIGISEGDIEDVTAFYADGEHIPVGPPAKSTTSAGGRVVTYLGTAGTESSAGAGDAVNYTGRFKAICYLDSSTPILAAANGESLQTASGGIFKTTDVVPIAWVHLQLIQGAAEVGGIAGPWRSARIPWEFLVKGMRISWPDQLTPKWTDDAAAIRYWYDTTIRGRTVDETAFKAARAICLGELANDLPTIQLSKNRLEMKLGGTNAITVSLDDTSGGPVTANIRGAPNDGVDVSQGSVVLPGNFDVTATKVGTWRLTISATGANPTTLLVEVTA